MCLRILCLFALGCSLAGAAQLDFTWSGQRLTHGFTGSGSGSIDFADGLTNIGLSDLTGFNFTYYINSVQYGGGNIPIVTHLADLTAFNLQVAPGNAGVNGVEAFGFDSYTPQYASSFSVFACPPGWCGDNAYAVEGPITFTAYESSAPEPVSFALIGLGMVAMGGWRKLARRSYRSSNEGDLQRASASENP
jgi:hypothetical protein